MPEENISKIENPEEELMETNNEEKTLLTWEAKEFQKRQYDPWKIGVLAVVAVILVIYSIIVANYLFALIVIMAAVIIQIFLRKEPENIGVAITNRGINIGDNKFSYEDDLRSFWILYNPPEVKTLNFDRKQALLPGLSIQLEDENPIKIREILLRFLPEDTEKEEDISERTARKLGI